jgi:homeobox protein HEX
MGSSKNKSSFRIADILHQQSDNSDLMRQIWKNSALNPSRSEMENTVSTTELNDSNLNDSSDVKAEETRKISNSPPNLETSSQSDCSGPFKPTPISYTNFLELQKQNFSFPFGLSAFHPAAYLNYADALQKGMFSITIFIILY